MFWFFSVKTLKINQSHSYVNCISWGGLFLFFHKIGYYLFLDFFGSVQGGRNIFSNHGFMHLLMIRVPI